MDTAWAQLQAYTKTYTSSPLSLTRRPHLSSSSSSPRLSLLMGASKGCGREPPLAVCSTGGVEGWGRLEEEAAARPRGCVADAAAARQLAIDGCCSCSAMEDGQVEMEEADRWNPRVSESEERLHWGIRIRIRCSQPKSFFYVFCGILVKIITIRFKINK